MTMRYTFQRGETIVLSVYDTGADPADTAKVTAGIKPVVPGTTEPALLSVVARTFITTFRPAADGFAKGWDFELPASQTATLLPGVYQFDIAIRLTPDEPVVSPAQYITIKEPASL